LSWLWFIFIDPSLFVSETARLFTVPETPGKVECFGKELKRFIIENIIYILNDIPHSEL